MVLAVELRYGALPHMLSLADTSFAYSDLKLLVRVLSISGESTSTSQYHVQGKDALTVSQRRARVVAGPGAFMFPVHLPDVSSLPS